MGREVFKKKLSGGSPEEIYTASSDACICAMAFEDQRLYWAQDGSIHSVIPSRTKPQETYKIRPAFQAENGLGIIGDTAYWTGIGKVYRHTEFEDASESTVKDLGTTNRQLNGLVVVKP